MFTSADRDRVRDEVLRWADSDSRVVSGAVVGSMAHRPGDRWSDLDLTFGVRDQVPLSAVLDDWTDRLASGFGAVRLFDLPSGGAIYRVFLLPGCLQFDLSFTPSAQFGAIGPNFRLLFGTAGEKPQTPPPSVRDLFGYAVHHAVRARACIERDRFWQAEYWISSIRDNALSLACVRLGLPPYFGRGFDDLPADVLERLAPALVQALTRDELMRALDHAVAGLLLEGRAAEPLASAVGPWLRELTHPETR